MLELKSWEVDSSTGLVFVEAAATDIIGLVSVLVQSSRFELLRSAGGKLLTVDSDTVVNSDFSLSLVCVGVGDSKSVELVTEPLLPEFGDEDVDIIVVKSVWLSEVLEPSCSEPLAVDGRVPVMPVEPFSSDEMTEPVGNVLIWASPDETTSDLFGIIFVTEPNVVVVCTVDTKVGSPIDGVSSSDESVVPLKSIEVVWTVFPGIVVTVLAVENEIEVGSIDDDNVEPAGKLDVSVGVVLESVFETKLVCCCSSLEVSLSIVVELVISSFTLETVECSVKERSERVKAVSDGVLVVEVPSNVEINDDTKFDGCKTVDFPEDLKLVVWSLVEPDSFEEWETLVLSKFELWLELDLYVSVTVLIVEASPIDAVKTTLVLDELTTSSKVDVVLGLSVEETVKLLSSTILEAGSTMEIEAKDDDDSVAGVEIDGYGCCCVPDIVSIEEDKITDDHSAELVDWGNMLVIGLDVSVPKADELSINDVVRLELSSSELDKSKVSIEDVCSPGITLEMPVTTKLDDITLELSWSIGWLVVLALIELV